MTNNLHSVRFSPDSKYLAYSEATNGIAIYNASSYQLINSTNAGFGFAYAMSFSRDSSKIAYNIHTSSTTGPRIISISTNNSITVSSPITSSITYARDLDYSFDGNKLIKCGDNGY